MLTSFFQINSVSIIFLKDHSSFSSIAHFFLGFESNFISPYLFPSFTCLSRFYVLTNLMRYISTFFLSKYLFMSLTFSVFSIFLLSFTVNFSLFISMIIFFMFCIVLFIILNYLTQISISTKVIKFISLPVP